MDEFSKLILDSRTLMVILMMRINIVIVVFVTKGECSCHKTCTI